jgi:hypothetical protein
VSHIRPSRLLHRPANFTPFEVASTGQNFMDKWPETHLLERGDGYSPTEYYLWSGSQTFASSRYVDVQLHALPRAVFAQRLTACWNAFWQAGLASSYYAGGMPTNRSAYDAANRSNLRYYVNETVATTVHVTPRYVCHKRWLALLVGASSALLLSGVIGLLAKYTASAPDILTHVSSLTRDNPFIPLGPGGNTLDGMERARALKRLPVRLRDVRPNERVGHIALTVEASVAQGIAHGGHADSSPGPRKHEGLFRAPHSRRTKSLFKNGRLYA